MRVTSTPLRMWGQERTEAEEIPWPWAEDRLRDAEVYWLVTVGHTGKPAARPAWGVLIDHSILLTLGSTTSWHNVGHHAGGAPVTLHLGDPIDVVIVEGTARRETDEKALEQLVHGYNAKYNWNFEVGGAGAVLAVDLKVVLAWRTIPAAECTPDMKFPDAAGRWVVG